MTIRRYRRRERHNAKPIDAVADQAESDRLRPLFLSWVGRRSNADGMRAAGLPMNAGQAWLSGRTLAAEHQIAVRRVLGEIK